MTTYEGSNVFSGLIEGATDGTFTNTEEYIELNSATLIIDGNEETFFHVQIEVDFPSTPTDDCIVSFYSTCDDTSEEFDVSPFYQITIDNADDPARKSIIISGFYRWRIGVKASGSTDTITSASVKIRGRSYK